MYSHIDFGYPWFLSYGHLLLFGVALLAFGIVRWRRWPKPILYLTGLFVIWSFTAFLVMRFVVDINGRAALPTPAFLAGGTGRVLDLGAGTGRSTIMVLEARPKATIVALDLFGESFENHFGKGDKPDEGQARLLENLKTAGVADRASIQAADMRHIPFEAAAFDAIVSCYAIDHLDRAGIRATLAEANRVLKPRGQFLLEVVGQEKYLHYAFGPLLAHMRTASPSFWPDSLLEAGFDVTEQGWRPATFYVLAVKRP